MANLRAFAMPKWGIEMTEGVVAEWKVGEGQPFRKGDLLALIETAKITNEESRIDWTQPARRVHDLVRGLAPFPGAFTEIDLGRGRERLKVLRSMPVAGQGKPGTTLDGSLTVACADGAVRLLQVQRAGSKPMAAEDFLRGVPVPPGTVLG